MKPSITAMLIISNLMSLSVYAEEAMFTCSTRENSSFSIIVDVDVETSVLVLTDSHVDGKVKSTAHHYFITYPATKDRYETHISINRYSGSLDWEHGDKPFGEMNPRNVFYNEPDCFHNRLTYKQYVHRCSFKETQFSFIENWRPGRYVYCLNVIFLLYKQRRSL